MTARKRPKDQNHSAQDLRDRLLLAALPDVAFDGWTPALLDRAATKAGIDAADLAQACPGGIDDLIVHFSNWADRQTEDRLATTDMTKLRVRDRIALGVRTRLEVLEPYKHAASAALGHAIDPRLSVRLAQAVWRTADRLWWLAGDNATDWNHYSKRTLLSGVLTATGLYWLSDTSDGHSDTHAFLDRRIDNVLLIGKSLGGLRGYAARIKHPFTARRRSTT